MQKTTTKITQRIAVIGGVAAGPAAAAEAKRVDPAADVVLFERGAAISYGACEIPYYLSGKLPRIDDLVVFGPDDFERHKGVSVRVNTVVEEINPRQQRIRVLEVTSGRSWEERFDKIILAVGASAKFPDVDGASSDNVFAVRDLAQAYDMRTAMQRLSASTLPEWVSRRIVIVGGGYVGVEVADALQSVGHLVSILQPGGRLLSGYLEPQLSERFTAIVARSVQVRDERLRSIVRDPANRVQAVLTDEGERIACGMVVSAIGIAPNIALAKAAGIRIGKTGAIKVTSGMRTSLPNVWACGDCIEVTRLPDGASVYSPLAPAAYRTARVAARNAAARGRVGQAVFDGVTPASALRAFGIEIASVGLTLQDAQKSGLDAEGVTIEHKSRAGMLPEAKPLFVHLVFERRSGRILGGQLLGEEGAALRANVLVPLIRSRSTLSSLADIDLIYTPPLAPSLDPLYVAARAGLRKVSRT